MGATVQRAQRKTQYWPVLAPQICALRVSLCVPVLRSVDSGSWILAPNSFSVLSTQHSALSIGYMRVARRSTHGRVEQQANDEQGQDQTADDDEGQVRLDEEGDCHERDVHHGRGDQHGEPECDEGARLPR